MVAFVLVQPEELLDDLDIVRSFLQFSLQESDLLIGRNHGEVFADEVLNPLFFTTFFIQFTQKIEGAADVALGVVVTEDDVEVVGVEADRVEVVGFAIGLDGLAFLVVQDIEVPLNKAAFIAGPFKLVDFAADPLDRGHGTVEHGQHRIQVNPFHGPVGLLFGQGFIGLHGAVEVDIFVSEEARRILEDPVQIREGILVVLVLKVLVVEAVVHRDLLIDAAGLSRGRVRPGCPDHDENDERKAHRELPRT